MLPLPLKKEKKKKNPFLLGMFDCFWCTDSDPCNPFIKIGFEAPPAFFVVLWKLYFSWVWVKWCQRQFMLCLSFRRLPMWIKFDISVPLCIVGAPPFFFSHADFFVWLATNWFPSHLHCFGLGVWLEEHSVWVWRVYFIVCHCYYLGMYEVLLMSVRALLSFP